MPPRIRTRAEGQAGGVPAAAFLRSPRPTPDITLSVSHVKSLLTGPLLLLALARGGEARQAPPAEATGGVPPLRALLVGCDEYPYLREDLGPELYERDVRLHGPLNDVQLMRSTLERVCALEPERTEVLAGWGAERTRPTRANILAALERLRAAAGPGERVVVYLAGHGSQQRVQRDKGLEEPDGLDEIFLPADVRQAKQELGYVPNSLRDDELGAALRAIRDAGAEVLLLVDACHSGGLLRGGVSNPDDGVRMRGLDPALLGVRPEPAHERPAAGPAPLQRGWIGSASNERISALYGAQSYGRAPEMPAPRGGREIHGLFTYVLCQELERSGGAGSYQELSERVVSAYQAFPCGLTVPSAEGDLARGLTGGVVSGARLLCGLRGADPWLQLGRLAGVERGLVARVFKRRGDERPIARVEVREAGLFDARARLLEGELPEGLLFPAEVERRSYGDWRLPVAVVDARGRAFSGAALPAELRDFLARSPERFPRVEPAAADWWLVCGPPAAGADVGELLGLRPGASAGGFDFFGVRAASLGADLERIQKARVLCDYAASDLTSGWTGELELVLERKPPRGRPQRLGRDAVLHPGDQIRIALDKRSARIFDVNVFYVDANYRLVQLFPQGEQTPRLDAAVRGEKVLTRDEHGEWLTIVDNALGLEHVLVFATPRAAESSVVDLSFLKQDGVLRGRAAGGPFQNLLQRVAGGQDLRGESLAVSTDVEGTQSLLVTLRTEWGPLAPPAWPRTGVVALPSEPVLRAGQAAAPLAEEPGSDVPVPVPAPEGGSEATAKPAAKPSAAPAPRVAPEAPANPAAGTLAAPPSEEPAAAPPDPWQSAARVALLASPAGNGKSDVLLLGDDGVRAVLIDFEGGLARAQDLAALVRTRDFGADAAFVFAADGRWALYRTRAPAQFDLALCDRDLDGVADERWTRATDQAAWSRVTGVALPWLSQGYLWGKLTAKAEDCTERLSVLLRER